MRMAWKAMPEFLRSFAPPGRRGRLPPRGPCLASLNRRAHKRDLFADKSGRATGECLRSLVATSITRGPSTAFGYRLTSLRVTNRKEIGDISFAEQTRRLPPRGPRLALLNGCHSTDSEVLRTGARHSGCSGHHVSDAGRVDACADVMRANDVHTFQDGHGLGGDGAVRTVRDGSVFAVTFQHSSDEGFARDASEQGVAKLVEFVEAAQERVVVFEILAETKAGVDGNALALHPGHGGGVGPVAQFALGEDDDVGDGSELAPFFGASAHVYEDGTAFEFGDSLGHLGIPPEGADVVNDLRSDFDRSARYLRFVCVDRDHGVRALLFQLCDHRDDALALFFFGDGLGGFGSLGRTGGVDAGAGPGGFAADVDDVGAVLEHAESVFESFCGIEEIGRAH